MYRARRMNFTALPKNLIKVHSSLDNMDVKSYRNENLLQINDRESNIVSFSANSNLIYLIKLTKIFINGTFTYYARIFCELFPIHAIDNEHYTIGIFPFTGNG